MSAHKSFNIVLVFITFVLAVLVAYLSQNDADKYRKLEHNFKQITIINDMKNVVHINNVATAATFFSAILLLLAIVSFYVNTKSFGALKGFLCLVVFVLGLMLLVLGSILMKYDTKNTNKVNFVNISIVAGIVSLLAVSSCSFTVFKMFK